MEAITTDTMTTASRSVIRRELIPDHVREDVCEVALNGYMAFEQYLKTHPEEARRFEERVAEVRKRRLERGAQG